MTSQRHFSRRYYPLHHFILYPLLALICCISIYGIMIDVSQQLIWLSVLCLTLLVALLSFITRQHYALGNQDRIIRLEMRLRYFILTGRSFDAIESRLRPRQVYALRYAGDNELLELIERAVKEDLSPRQIRGAIQNWQRDPMRL
jgi:hypothetical protein